MKAGSLVELINDDFFNTIHLDVINNRDNCYPKIGLVYTVRDVVVDGPEAGLLLEEIINPEYVYPWGIYEMAFDIRRFRELMPPLSIAELSEKEFTL